MESQPPSHKSPGLAALASFLVPGLGQVYNGTFMRGLGVLSGTIVGSFFLVIPGIIVFIFGIYDAYTTAKKMISGEIPLVEHNMAHIIFFIFIAVGAGIIGLLIFAGIMIALGFI